MVEGVYRSFTYLLSDFISYILTYLYLPVQRRYSISGVASTLTTSTVRSGYASRQRLSLILPEPDD